MDLTSGDFMPIMNSCSPLATSKLRDIASAAVP
jgi:hypothetical protein